MARANYQYCHGHVTVEPAGVRRFLIVAGNGNGRSYILKRALGKLKRRGGATVERTGHGSTVYLQLPETAKATGASFADTTAQDIADFIAVA